MRLAFALLVCMTAALAIVVGAEASPPSDPPAYALDSAVIYRCEVSLAFFLCTYLIVVAIALAFDGRTVGKISTAGIELPAELSFSVTQQRALIDRQERMQKALIERDERLFRNIEGLADGLKQTGGYSSGKGGKIGT